jgi:hypothetical protein
MGPRESISASFAAWCTEREIVPEGAPFFDGQREAWRREQARAIGANCRQLICDLVHPVGAEARWSRSAICHAEDLARCPGAA